MKFRVRLFFLLMMIICSCLGTAGFVYASEHKSPADIPGNTNEAGAFAPSDAPEIVSRAAVVIDIETGDILYQKSPDEKTSVAGLGKMMTALTALEAAEDGITLDTEFVISGNSYYGKNRDSNDISLVSGESISFRNLLYGMLLKSGDEAACAIAEGFSGSTDDFVAKMNELAGRMGLESSDFKTPVSSKTTFDADGNVTGYFENISTAYEMAVITRELYKYPIVRTIIESDSYTIPATNSHDARELWQDNRMKYKANKDYYYDRLIGGKVGYSETSGGCYVSFAQKNGVTLACVILGADPVENIYLDSKTLYEFCFDNYTLHHPIRGYSFEGIVPDSTITENYYASVEHSLPYYKVDDKLSIYTRKSITDDQLRVEPEFYQKPSGNEAGRIYVYYNDLRLSEVPILLKVPEVYANIEFPEVLDTEAKNVDKDAQMKPLLIKLIVILVVIIFIVIIFLMLVILKKGGRSGKDGE